MISETRYILTPISYTEADLLDEMIDYGHLDEESAKRAAFFGANHAPHSSVMKVTIHIEEITK